MAHGIVMILIPWSIFFFLLIVLVKVICFFYAESKKRGQRRAVSRPNSYGQFNEEESLEQDAEAVIGIYFKIMERVNYRTVTQEEAE